MSPKVSIIVPFYNTQNYIEECVKSLIQQSFADIEMIFVNDGSIDKSRDIIAQYQEKDSRILIIDQDNGGAGRARNAGLAKARASYVMFCDSDDFYQPEMVTTMVALIEKEDDIDLAMCSCHVLDAKISKRNDKKYLFNNRNGIYDLTQYMKRQVNIILWNKIFKRSLLEQHYIDFAELRTHEDENFIYKYLAVSLKINFTSQPLYNYRYRKDSISEETRINPAYIGDYLTCFENVLAFMKTCDVFKNSQSYFSDALIHAAWLIDDKFYQKLDRKTERLCFTAL